MISINPGYTLKQVADEYIIIATGDRALQFSAVLVLNEVGAQVFKMLQVGKTQEEITTELMSLYEIDQATATADAQRFIDKLIGDGVCTHD